MFFFNGRPILRVEIMGTVVKVDQRPANIVFTGMSSLLLDLMPGSGRWHRDD